MTDTSIHQKRVNADGVIRRIHRISAILFLISIPPAFWASFQGGEPLPLVYLPLFPLLGLALTGCYQLAMPWIRGRGVAQRRMGA